MDCRWSLCLAVALVGGAVGCDHMPLWPSSDFKDKANSEAEAKGSVWKRQEKLKPETLVYYGSMKEKSALESRCLA